MKTTRISTLLLACLLGIAPLKAQNYDETKVPVYTLPHLLTASDGTPVTTAKQWKKQRRPELMELLATHGYGHTPQEKIAVKHEVIQENPQALGGRATMQQVRFTFAGQGKTIEALLLVYFPNQRRGKVPVFISYNFKGNHSTSTDADIRYSPYFEQLPIRQDPILVRGNQASRWSIPLIIERGYAVATMCYHDIYPDHKNGEDKSVLALFPAHTRGQGDSWQALGGRATMQQVRFTFAGQGKT
ncbi:MAG: acetylxylan esterase, partial [Bacteroidaceae bacterium]|nr:acetylxylan esterase [Bacteroidaceae bacterium]